MLAGAADNAVNGKPTCANKGLLTTILRDTWKWDGFVVSDYDVRRRFSSRAPIPLLGTMSLVLLS